MVRLQTTMRLSKTNNVNKNHKQNIHETLCTVSPTNQFRRQGNNLSKKPSNANRACNYMQQQKINELQEEINKLQHQQIANNNQEELKQHIKLQTY